MVQKDPPDCSERCRSTQHGDIITAAISRRSVTDLDLCSYLSYTCTCCESVKDSVGRTALHVAASCGRLDLVRWLVQNRHAPINAKDDESGFTALHRSIFYGKLAITIELIKLGADTSILDASSLTVLDHAASDSFKPDEDLPGELYTWGANCNHSMGPNQSKTMPELSDAFHKKFPGALACKVCVEKFHSMVLAQDGRVYACGHGQGGRLGLGTQSTVVLPELVHFPDLHSANEPSFCVDVAVARDHSVFLTSEAKIYTCGMNANRVLGLRAAPKEALVPTLVRRCEGVEQVKAGRFHSIAWGPKHVYTWGLNAGQLGHKIRSDEKFVFTPKLVSVLNLGETTIAAVDSSDAAIVIYTKKGDIFALHEYQCRKIASRQLNVTQVSVFGGRLDPSICKEISGELKIAALTNTGNVYLWQESDPQLCRCIFSLNRPIIIKQVTINLSGFLFVTRSGEAFQGFIKPRKKKTIAINDTKKSAFHKFLDREDCISLKVAKFARIYRATSIASDAKGVDFCVVQAAPYKRFEAPTICASEMKANFRRLLDECAENDALHDVVFKVNGRFFPAHRYILAAKSAHFAKLFADFDGEIIDLGTDFNDRIFEQFLLFAYTGDSELMQIGQISIKWRDLCEKQKEENCPMEDIDGKQVSAYQIYKKSKSKTDMDKMDNKLRNPVRMLHEMAKRFACTELCTLLSNFEMQKCVIKRKSLNIKQISEFQFDRTNSSQPFDVTIKCSDGKEVKAHKCILAAQTDYFNNLFSSRWHGTETSTITLPCTRSVVEALLEYLYTDTLSYLNNKEQDHLFKLIVLADQLFITRLKEQCEYLLYKCLTLKNCVQFLVFSSIYNAEKLKYCCMKFIIDNIAPLLELRAFDEVDEALLKSLGEFYFEEKSAIWCRVITPYSTAPLEEEIVSISSAFPVCLDDEIKRVVQKSGGQKRRSRTHKNSDNLKGASIQKEEEVENVIQFPDSPDVNSNLMENSVPNRLKSIQLAQEKLYDEDSFEFTKLVSRHDFPVLNSPPNLNFVRSPPQNRLEARHKLLKMSQKQRKRLTSDGSVEVGPVEGPKNPWKTNGAEASSPRGLGTSITEIICAERKQKENLVKITSKLLIYTQIEDKAIEDLRRFYNSENENDEVISVERVAMGAVAAPVWVPGVKKLENVL